MKAPDIQIPPIDPATLSAEQTAQQDQINALKTRTMGDSASLMAQYGILATAGSGNAVTSSASSAPPPSPRL